MPKQLVEASANTVQDSSNIFQDALSTYAIEEPQFLPGSNAPTTKELTPDQASVASFNPVEAYIDLLPLEEEPVVLTVAKDSQSLQSIMMLIDNKEEVECITDNSSQIISMSVKIASNLGLSYDPNIVLNMQSTNGTVDQSLGLAHNTLPISTSNADVTSTYVNIPFPTQFVANKPPKRKGVQVKKKYKPVAMKTKPVAGHISEDFQIEQHIIGDLLATMPPLDPIPPPFIPTK
ncbi:hypothetical protein C0989_004955 [Termitomyces sp. Mn162]|nr:hypothetical protein C0989_004955 [Termitomyces sp. Mn162]